KNRPGRTAGQRAGVLSRVFAMSVSPQSGCRYGAMHCAGIVVAGLVTGSRVYPTLGRSSCATRAGPSCDAIHAFTARMTWMPGTRPGMTWRDWRIANHASLILEPIAGLEDPPDGHEAQRQEQERHAQADCHIDVRDLEEGPAESADQVDHRIEQRHRLPDRRQHADRIEAAAEEGKRRDDEQRDDLQLLETIRPDADDEAEQAERQRRQDDEAEHPERVRNLQGHQ